MTLEEIRTYYVTARNFVKIGNSANTQIIISSIEAISEHIKQIYQTASILDKAKCKLQYESFDNVIALIKINGIKDRRVLAFFGLAPSTADAPSFSDIMSGDGAVSKPAESNQPKSPVKPPEKSKGEGDGAVAPVPSPVSPVKPDKTQPLDGTKPIQNDTPSITQSPADGSKGGGTEKPTFEPQSLRDFIGQEHIVKALLKEIAIAKAEGRKHLDNILLFGNPGLGKSTLMELIAKELGVKFELLDCSQFRNSQQSLKALQSFFVRVARDNEPVVIALDEVHMLTDELQSSLLTLLNNRVYVSPLDVNGHNTRIPIDEFTFIAATTDDDQVLGTIKNRCLRLTFQMEDYKPEELKRIYKNKIAAKGLTADEEAIDACIPRSRAAIRYVNSIVEGLNTALYNDEGVRISTHITLEIALKYFAEKGIDPIGLTKKDLEILRVIAEEASGVISADVLSARVGLETKKYLSEYERYLVKIKFVSVSGRGRSLTEAAIKYLNGDSGDGKETADGGADVNPVSSDNPVSDSTDEIVAPTDSTDNGGEGDGENGSSDSSAPKDIIDDLFGN